MRYESRIWQIGLSALLIVILAAITAVNTAYAGSGEGEANSSFSLRSVKGGYGFVIDGVSINVIDSTTTPAAAVGRFTADGNGNIVEGVRSLNVGGSVQEEVFTGTYTVNENGTGELTVHVDIVLPDGSTVPATTETGRFVINRPHNELQFIGTSIKGPAGEDLGLLLVTRGVARQQ